MGWAITRGLMPSLTVVAFCAFVFDRHVFRFVEETGLLVVVILVLWTVLSAVAQRGGRLRRWELFLRVVATMGVVLTGAMHFGDAGRPVSDAPALLVTILALGLAHAANHEVHEPASRDSAP